MIDITTDKNLITELKIVLMATSLKELIILIPEFNSGISSDSVNEIQQRFLSANRSSK